MFKDQIIGIRKFRMWEEDNWSRWYYEVVEIKPDQTDSVVGKPCETLRGLSKLLRDRTDRIHMPIELTSHYTFHEGRSYVIIKDGKPLQQKGRISDEEIGEIAALSYGTEK